MNTKKFWKRLFGMFEKGDRILVVSSFAGTVNGREGIIISRSRNGFWLVKVDEGCTRRYASYSIWHFSIDEIELL